MTPRPWSRLSFCVVVLAGLLPATAGAQSLAAVARSEEARRGKLPKSSKVYTNQDLKRDPTAPLVAPAATPDGSGGDVASAPAAGGSQAPADAAPDAPDPQRTEKYWRDRMGAARAQLQRSQMFASALQSQINALTTDFVNRDDPAQRAVIEQNRLKALAELEKVQREVSANTKAISDIEDDARKASVPAGWLR